MKKYLTLLLLTLAISFSSRAQYVPINDPVFVTWLQYHGYGGCLSGNQLDTTNPVLAEIQDMAVYHVAVTDLSCLQYFKALQNLDCSSDTILTKLVLPPNLYLLNCQYDAALDSMPLLPASIAWLTCGSCNFNHLQPLPADLITLDVSYNPINMLPALPLQLQSLNATGCNLSALPALPATLTTLECGENILNGNIPPLPAGLQNLTVNDDSLTALPTLPQGLLTLDCGSNYLTVLSALPDSLTNVALDFNLLTSLPTLPPNLRYLGCSYNNLHTLPVLPLTITELDCNDDSLSALPALPASLAALNCYENQLTTLPPLPVSSTWDTANGIWGFYLDCSSNYITSISNLPDTMAVAQLSHNPFLTCLPQLGFISQVLNFSYTGITCLPNYGTVDSSNPVLNTVPLCSPGAPCGVFWDITGAVYYDANNDCLYDYSDSGFNQVKVMLYNNGVLQQQTYTGGAGLYSFNAPNYNTYNVVIDTSNIPFAYNSACPDTGSLPVTLNAQDSSSTNNNFAFVCYPGSFDLGVQSIWYNYQIIARPATVIPINNIAGDLTALYGAHCATGIGGQVQVIYNGQAAYVGPQPGALTPTAISGDTLTYSIADFGQVNPLTAFNIYLQLSSDINSAGSQVCVTVTVTPGTPGDYNLSNNTLSYCLTIVDALDPNSKEVYPAQAVGGGQWLTYTIRFQNTGTAPAQNIVVRDTLSSNLDISSFTLLTNSAKCSTQLYGNVAVFTFNYINLVDSITSDSASRGYVQFKIKTNSNVTVNDMVGNTGYVYFDLNPAVVTNTALVNGPTNIVSPTAQSNIAVTAYPNPFNDITNIQITGLAGTDKYNFELYDVTGRLQLSIPSGSASHFPIARGKLATGIYTYQLSVGEERTTAFGKLVIQ